MFEIFVNKCFDIHFYFLFFHYSFYTNYQRIVSGISQNFSTTPYLVYKPNISSTDPKSRLQIQHLVYRSNILTISLTGPTSKPKCRLQIKHLIYISNIPLQSNIQHCLQTGNLNQHLVHWPNISFTNPTSRSQTQHLVHRPNILYTSHLIHRPTLVLRPNISSTGPTSRSQAQHLVHRPNISSTCPTARLDVHVLVYSSTFSPVFKSNISCTGPTSRSQAQHLVHRPNILSTLLVCMSTFLSIHASSVHSPNPKSCPTPPQYFQLLLVEVPLKASFDLMNLLDKAALSNKKIYKIVQNHLIPLSSLEPTNIVSIEMLQMTRVVVTSL